MTEPSGKVFEDKRFTAILGGIGSVCSAITAAVVLGIAANMVTINKAVDKLMFTDEVIRRDLDATMQDTEANKGEIKELWRETDKTKLYSMEMQRRLGLR